MPDQINQRLSELKTRITSKARLKTDLTHHKDQVLRLNSQQAFLETHLEMLERDIRKLEGFGLSGLLGRLTGNQQQKVEKKRRLYDDEKDKLESCLIALGAAREELVALEDTFNRFDDLEAEYQDLCRQKEEQLLAQCPEYAETLANMDGEIQRHREEIRRLEHAMEAAEEPLLALHSLFSSLKRAGSKHIGAAAAPPIISAAMNTLFSMTGIPSATHARKAMQNLVQKLQTLQYADHPDDQAILQLTDKIENLASKMDASWAMSASGHPAACHEAESDIMELKEFLGEKLENTRTQLAESQQSRLAVLETAD